MEQSQCPPCLSSSQLPPQVPTSRNNTTLGWTLVTGSLESTSPSASSGFQFFLGATHLSPLLDPHFVESTEVCGGGHKLISISHACGDFGYCVSHSAGNVRMGHGGCRGLHHHAGATHAPGMTLIQWRQPSSDNRRPTVWTSWLRGPVSSPSACSSLS